jgi:hypothetical protein
MAQEEGKVYYDERAIADQKRFEEQCFLLDHWFYLCPLSINWQNGRWPNITLLEGNPYNAIHSLFSVKNLNPLITLTPLELAALQPRIRLFKVVECKAKDGKTSKVLKELPFKNSSEKTTLDNLLNTREARGDNVGLKSFSYKLIGTTHGSEEKNILCELNLVFKNLKDIFASTGGVPATAVTECEKTQASFKDLIVYPPTRTAAIAGDIDPFQIKIHVGFADPARGLKNLDISAERKQELIRIIRMMNDTLSLTLVEHEFDFKQDGSADLKITYQGAFESKLTSGTSDIFQPSEDHELEEIASLRKEIGDLNSSRSDISSQTKQGQDPSKGAKKALEDVDEALEKKAVDLRKALNRDMQTKYAKLVDHMTSRVRLFPVVCSAWMFGRDKDGGWAARGRGAWGGGGTTYSLDDGTFWALPIQPGSPGAARKGAADASEWKKWHATIQASMTAAASETDDAARQKIYDSLKSRRAGKAGSGDSLYDPGGKESGKDKGRGVYANQWVQKFRSDLIGSKIQFQYFYLGDLISAALHSMGFKGDLKSEERYPDFRVLLGNILFNDPYSGMEVDGGINLAHVPISLNMFRAWFVENVVRKQISVYPFQKFIRDVIRGLILPALGENCNVGQAAPPGAKPTAQHIAVPKSRHRDPTRGLIDRIPKGAWKNGQVLIQSNVAGRFTIDQIIPTNVAVTSFQDINKAVMNYVYISSIGNSNVDREGDKQKDHESGIIHLNVGSPHGLLKKVVFNRVELENLVELRSQETLQGSDNQLQIQRVYDCDITMVGNSLFKPGMMVYVNPTMAGGGNPKAKNSISRKLGIGGYYFILEVENIIEPGVYETMLKTKFLGLGKIPGRNPIESATAAQAIRTLKVAVEELTEQKAAQLKLKQQVDRMLKDIFDTNSGHFDPYDGEVKENGTVRKKAGRKRGPGGSTAGPSALQ